MQRLINVSTLKWKTSVPPKHRKKYKDKIQAGKDINSTCNSTRDSDLRNIKIYISQNTIEKRVKDSNRQLQKWCCECIEKCQVPTRYHFTPTRSARHKSGKIPRTEDTALRSTCLHM